MTHLTAEDLDALGCTPWDSAEHIDSEEMAKAYVNEVSEGLYDEGMLPYTEASILGCIDTVNRARTMNRERQKQSTTPKQT